MISPLSQAQLSIYLSCQGIHETDGNYQLYGADSAPAGIPLEYDVVQLSGRMFDFLSGMNYFQS